MKLITSICLLLIAAASLPLRAADGQTVVVKSSSAEDNVVVLHAELAGKETEFRCVINSPPCAAAPAGEYVMVRAEAAEAIYNDCTDVVLYRFMPDAKEKIGVYCWSTSGDCYIASCTPLEIQTVPSSVPDKILGERPNQMDCSTLTYRRHKVSCLCGTVSFCSGDICGNPSNYDLDDDITVELRDKVGATILDSKKVIVETRAKEGTTQVGTKVFYETTERTFCFEGRRDGDYQLAFILHKQGVPQPAVVFPTDYKHERKKACDAIYMVEPICPR